MSTAHILSWDGMCAQNFFDFRIIPHRKTVMHSEQRLFPRSHHKLQLTLIGNRIEFYDEFLKRPNRGILCRTQNYVPVPLCHD